MTNRGEEDTDKRWTVDSWIKLIGAVTLALTTVISSVGTLLSYRNHQQLEAHGEVLEQSKEDRREVKKVLNEVKQEQAEVKKELEKK